MAYRIRHKDRSAGAAVRRIARQQVEAALACIDGTTGDAGRTLHEVRKRCKKIRALLRLVHPGRDADGAGNAACRAIAAPLGPRRDADVLLETFDDLLTGCSAPEVAALAPVRAALGRHRETIRARDDTDNLLREARDALAATLPHIARWTLEDDGFAAYSQGLEARYRRGRRTMREACHSGDAEVFHRWRKCSKDLAFHLRLLGPIWPGPMRAQRTCADALGDTLGRHHDLAVLAAQAGRMPDIPAQAVEALVARIDARQRALAQAADALGARLYAEPPRALAKSWRRRYAAWVRERDCKG